MAHDTHPPSPYIYVMKLSDIEGESAIADHKKEIVLDKVMQEYETHEELDKFAQGAKKRPAIRCSGITVVKRYEQSTPALLTALTEGTQIAEGLISCYAQLNKLFLKIKFINAVVQQADVYFEPEGNIVEITFAYEEITHTYAPSGVTDTIFEYKAYTFP